MNLCCMENTQQKVMCEYLVHSVFCLLCFFFVVVVFFCFCLKSVTDSYCYKFRVRNEENLLDIVLSFYQMELWSCSLRDFYHR